MKYKEEIIFIITTIIFTLIIPITITQHEIKKQEEIITLQGKKTKENNGTIHENPYLTEKHKELWRNGFNSATKQ